ncbi:MAG: N-6 DNA methylase [Candidatus Kapabacteria bacterium]|nr:N-6 DNA methylase [Candidatus Kapabacteria bacterium]
MTLHQYIDSINKRYTLGNATEHTFRGDLQNLLESLVPAIHATNEPKRQNCGAPDYILTMNDIPVGFIEAKDIGDKDLDGIKKTGNKEQFDRYKASLNNIIFTDYLDFHLYRDGQFVRKIAIGEVNDKGTIIPLTENFDAFALFIKDFCTHIGLTIKSSKTLAKMMAGKARLLSQIIEKALNSDEDNDEDSTLKDQMHAFKQILIHDITAKGFADVYAQTITYGMFAARLHDPTLPTFSRQEAFELIPKSNPFLKKLFGYIAGLDLDERIRWIVDDLVQIFLACNVEEMLSGYGKTTKMEDPIIHFYEDFLSEYDPALRKARGVWYTPQPVVNFIVRAVDDILKQEFGLSQGLADKSMTTIQVEQQGKKIQKDVHKVQILDPATGTGTFLAEVVKHIYKKFQGQQGIWSNYVEQHLLPRLNGFELLMASYAMAHLKLDLLLTETGYKPTTNQRFRVFLTNSLEESHPDTGTLFANWLSAEANEANYIKRDTPVMCIIGNPPYSVSSTNKNKWIDTLMVDYKQGLNDKNIQPLSDDYLKFIRYGQSLIEKNGSGVLAYISNNSFIDSVIHRQMRKHLLESFDTIYILDLHGSTKKNETAIDGTKDENVFDIQQGVSINIFIKKGKNQSSTLFKYDLFGKRDFKYDFLHSNSLSSINWQRIEPTEDRYYFKDINALKQLSYNEFIPINLMFMTSGAGVQTKRDNVFVDFDKFKLENRINSILSKTISDTEVISLNIKNSSSYRLVEKIDNSKYQKIYIKKYNYRVFDDRFIYYDKDLLGRAFYSTMKHLLYDNISLLTSKQQSSFDFQHSFITKQLTDHNSISLQTSEATHAFPLYLYPETSNQEIIGGAMDRVPNFNAEIVQQIADKLGMKFTNEKESTKNTFAPIDILDYIYAVLHSPTYREKYKEFLKIDFPRVPYPKDKATFAKLVKLGGQIREIHLLESAVVENYITQYPIDGNNMVGKVKYHDGKVYINESQYFDNVPLIAWEFYIGGYQPAQKWLKDRKDRALDFDDILHYQKIIVALSETARLMKEIDRIEIE